MSITVTISGNKSELTSYFQPPLNLSGQYECGLLNFSVLNSVQHFRNNIQPLIRIECDLVHGSYSNGLPTHVIHEFMSSTAPGNWCIESPQNVIYLPVNKTLIPSISIKIVDQFGHSIDFGKQQIELRLHLKKIK